jgi:hypothetical protein
VVAQLKRGALGAGAVGNLGVAAAHLDLVKGTEVGGIMERAAVDRAFNAGIQFLIHLFFLLIRV